MAQNERLVTVIAVLALAAVLAACGRSEERPGPTGEHARTGVDAPLVSEKAAPDKDPANLTGTEWVLASLDGREPVEGSTINLNFYSNGEFDGDAGCNDYLAQYEVSGSEFRLPNGVTETNPSDPDCNLPQSVRRQEKAYLDALQDAAAFRTAHDRLEISDLAGRILTFTPREPPSVDPALKGTEWALESLNGEGVLDDVPIVLEVGADGIGGYDGCNPYSSERVTMDGGVLHNVEFGLGIGACSGDVGEQASAYSGALEGGVTYSVRGDRLEIRDIEGETTLVYRRQPG